MKTNLRNELVNKKKITMVKATGNFLWNVTNKTEIKSWVPKKKKLKNHSLKKKTSQISLPSAALHQLRILYKQFYAKCLSIIDSLIRFR